MITSRQKILFSNLQRAIYSQDQADTIRGKLRIKILDSREISNLFEQAAQKLREEAHVATLREKWSAQDAEVYQVLENMLSLNYSGDFDEFKKQLRRKLAAAEREFYRQYKPENGGKVRYLYI